MGPVTAGLALAARQGGAVGRALDAVAGSLRERAAVAEDAGPMEAMSGKLESWLHNARPAEVSTRELDEPTLQELRALGYVR